MDPTESSTTTFGRARNYASDRSLITLASLIALNRSDQLRFHLTYAIEDGVKKEELIEVITHLAFYAGWPHAMSAIMIAKELFSKA
jgi:4-carboxymuconolactone decarboxylase